MAAATSNNEVGQVLYISQNTVEAHVKPTLAKLDAIGRPEPTGINRG
jgi:DNA-binding CsgD family transcriptional regulator